MAATSLIMLAAAIGAVAFLDLPVAKSQANAVITQQRLAAIRHALLVYNSSSFIGAGNFPCPAAFVAEGNASFGVSVGTTIGTVPYAITICDSTTDCNTAGLGNFASAICFGAVPVRNLGLPKEYALDGWGRYFSYYRSTGATAAIYVGNLTESLSPLPSTALYSSEYGRNLRNIKIAVVSHGEDGKGAYKGTSIATACDTTSGTANTADAENCDNNDVYFRYGPWNNGATTAAYKYDDFLMGINGD